MIFWNLINKARLELASGSQESVDSVCHEIESFIRSTTTAKRAKFADFYQKFLETYRLNGRLLDGGVEKLISQVSDVDDRVGVNLESYVKRVGEGVSLVTCCKNRNENLLKALPSWIQCKEVSEIIIVDWDSEQSVRASIAAAGLYDSRIKIVRVDNQPRWVLSYAFNVGFRAASYSRILKTDADIVLSPDFFKKNPLPDSAFLSGDWRIAAKGQEFINGFFYVSREALMNIKGFNEHITTYGWDDDDIYDRLEASGVRRTHVHLDTIHHLPHDDFARVGSNATSSSPIEQLHSEPRFKIRTNRFIANVMPSWNRDRIMLPFKIAEVEHGYIKLSPAGESIHQVPAHVRDDAEFYAEIELASWSAGLRVFELQRAVLRRLLSVKAVSSLSKLDVEAAIYNPSSAFTYAPYYVVLDLAPSFIAKAGRQLGDAIAGLVTNAKQLGVGVLLASDTRSQVAELIVDSDVVGFVPRWRNLGNLQEVGPKHITKLKRDEINNHFLIRADETAIKDLATVQISSAPTVLIRKPRMFIDAQHGLGNRLRAMASAAVIAEKTGRELVVVWQPDHHCECRLSDIFDYDGAVIEESFLKEAKQKGAQVFNYMEVESDAVKDQPLELLSGKDVYARSAYVLNNEHSNWSDENAFLKSLTPSKAVRELISPFNVSGHVGVHVRMEAGKGLDHNTYDSIENWTKEGHDQLHYWREQSHYSRFIKRLDALILENPNTSIFLAADMPEIYEVFQKYYGDRIKYLKRDVYDRSREQIVYGLADALLLSKCGRLMGSTWSSFSELAMRMSSTFSNIEMSGKDF